MKLITIKKLTLLALLCSLPFASHAANDDDTALFVSKADARVAHASAFRNGWDGPKTGPKLAEDKLIVFIGNDLAGDSSVQKLASKVKEVIGTIGWHIQIIDCYGLPARRQEAFYRAMALKPAAIIFADADAKPEAKAIAQAAEKKIPVIGWHAALTTGPVDGLFTNIGTDPKDAGQLAAYLAIADSRGKAGVVILSDTSSVNLATKSIGMIEAIKACQTCSLLRVEQITPGEKPDQILHSLSAMSKELGPRLTYVLATNDHLFDDLSGTEANNAFGGEAKFQVIGAGFGSSNAFTRMHAKKLQIGTVAEPINMQAWQLIDEANRAIAGEKPSGYNPESYIATVQNLAYHGGQNNNFDPANGYQDAYKKIWGK